MCRLRCLHSCTNSTNPFSEGNWTFFGRQVQILVNYTRSGSSGDESVLVVALLAEIPVRIISKLNKTSRAKDVKDTRKMWQHFFNDRMYGSHACCLGEMPTVLSGIEYLLATWEGMGAGIKVMNLPFNLFRLSIFPPPQLPARELKREPLWMVRILRQGIDSTAGKGFAEGFLALLTYADRSSCFYRELLLIVRQRVKILAWSAARPNQEGLTTKGGEALAEHERATHFVQQIAQRDTGHCFLG
jgi:hypothetical protein